MPVKSAIVLRHDANVAEVNRLSTLLKMARAAAAESGKAVAREGALKERQAMRDVVERSKMVGAKGKDKVIKVCGKQPKEQVKKNSKILCRPFVAAVAAVHSRRGRPRARPGECSQCARLARGEAGGHGHDPDCPRAKNKWARL